MLIFISEKELRKMIDDRIEISGFFRVNDKVVSCKECGAFLYKENAFKVIEAIDYHNEVYYCKKCRPPYDEVYIVPPGHYSVCGYYKDTYIKNNVKVDKKGKPI